MNNQQLCSSKINLYYVSTFKKDDCWNKLEKPLSSALVELEKFLWSDHLEVKRHKIKRIDLTLTLCGDAKMKSINEAHRAKAKTTDVLSFPLHEDLRAGNEQDFFGMKEIELGDLIISRDVATRQAKRFKVSFASEVIHLMVHGVLHLCGHDHEVSKKEEKIMQDLETKLVDKIYKRMEKDHGRVY